MSELKPHERLHAIQQELKAPKNQRNNFGKYNYRSLEDIMESVKPLLKEYKCNLKFNDITIEVAGIPVVSAEAIISTNEGLFIESVTAQAGVDVNRKGMDISQSFGASSSYARKYAANGLFLIDDTKDADATNTHGKELKKPSEKPLLTRASNNWKKAVEFIEKADDKKAAIEKIRASYSIGAADLKELEK